MLQKIRASIELTKASLHVLREEKQLIIFPALSSIALLLVLASFALPVVMFVDFEGVAERGGQGLLDQTLAYVLLFIFYFVNFFVMSFFNAALITCAINRFNGECTNVSTGLRAAADRLPQIFGWALIAATVGVILRAIAERSGLLGRIVIGLIGFVWAVATYFVVPVIVVQGLGPIDAIKQSAGLIRKTWGEAAISNIGVGFLGFLLSLAALAPLGVGVMLTLNSSSPMPLIVGVAMTIVLVVAVSLVISTLKVILVAALYRYASTGLCPEHFDSNLLRQIITSKDGAR